MRVTVIVNPHASGVSPQRRDRALAALAARHDVEVAHTTHAGHATELARRAVAAGAELVATLGGDGTVNEVVNGLAGSGVPLGLLGGGRANVLQRGLGLPAGGDGATAALLELLAAGARRRISLGRAGGRYFTFSAGLGLDGAVVREVERRQRAKHRWGDAAYVAAALRTLLVSYDRRRPHLRACFGDGRQPLTGFFAMVANGDPYSYLGPRPFRPTPQARYERGLDLLLGQTMAAGRLARAVLGMLSRRPYADPELPVLPDQEAFTLSSDVPLALQLDGEYLGERTEVPVRCARGALTVVCAPGRR